MLFHVTIVGHSYVKDLANLGKFDIRIENNTFFLKFLPFPGATFCTFIDNPALFERIKETNPDFVIVILGGNDLKANIELSRIYDRCKSFYTTLRSYLPNSWIIASQIENRFYHPQTLRSKDLLVEEMALIDLLHLLTVVRTSMGLLFTFKKSTHCRLVFLWLKIV